MSLRSGADVWMSNAATRDGADKVKQLQLVWSEVKLEIEGQENCNRVMVILAVGP